MYFYVWKVLSLYHGKSFPARVPNTSGGRTGWARWASGPPTFWVPFFSFFFFFLLVTTEVGHVGGLPLHVLNINVEKIWSPKKKKCAQHRCKICKLFILLGWQWVDGLPYSSMNSLCPWCPRHVTDFWVKALLDNVSTFTKSQMHGPVWYQCLRCCKNEVKDL